LAGTKAVYGKIDVIDQTVIKKARASECSTTIGAKLPLFFNDRKNVNVKFWI
jgi:hypothetical protein